MDEIVFNHNMVRKIGFRVEPGSRKHDLCSVYWWYWLAWVITQWYVLNNWDVKIRRVYR